MHSSIILTSLLAALAVATPVEKRYLTTKVEIYTVWTTVTKGDAAPTPFSNVNAEDSSDDDDDDYYRGGRGRGRGRGGHGSSSSAVDEPTTVPSSSEVVVPTSTPQPAPSSSNREAPVSSDEPASTSSEESAQTSEPASIPVTSEINEGVSASAPAPSAPAPSAPAPSSPAPVPAVGSPYGQKILDQHNIHRANHTDTNPLTWSNKLAATALKIANSCVYEHDTATDKSQYGNGQGYGQNIGAGSPPEEVPAMITNGMYNDEAPAYEGLYGQDDPDMSNFHVWGHFSQIVWRNTKEVGCATVRCNTLRNTSGNIRPYFTVCNYAPPGNYGGEYTNVGTRLGNPTVTV